MKTLATITGKWVDRYAGSRDSLRRLALVGSQYLLVRSIVISCLELIKTVIFSRILFPDDYGIIALAMLPIGLFEAFSAIGVEVMIQRDGEDYLRRIPGYWTLRLARGLLIFGASWVAASPLAGYYHNPELIMLVRFLGLSFLFGGLSGFGREIRQRHMQYARVVVVDSITAFGTLVIGLSVLFYSTDYWALATYHVSASFFSMVSSYVLFPWKPSLRWSKEVFHGVSVFSVSIILINLLNYVFNNLDKGLIGKMFGLEELGYYTRGCFLALIPATQLIQTLSPVVFNALRKTAEDPARLRHAFWKICIAVFLVAAGTGVVFFIFARQAIVLIYGERWLPALPVLQAMIIYGITKSIVMVCPAVFFIKGKPWMISIATAVMVVVFALTCYPLTVRFGVAGAATAVVISGIVSHGLSLAMVFRILRCEAGNPKMATASHPS